MKKILTLCMLMLFVSMQFIHAQDIHFGAKAGLNLSYIHPMLNTGKSSDLLPGFHVGGMVEFEINTSVSIAPEILYSTMGASEAIDQTITNTSGFLFTETITGTAKTTLNYIQLPIMAKVKMSNGLNFFAGPYVGMFMNGNSVSTMTVKTTTNFTGTPVTASGDTISTVKLDSATNKIDFGIGFGLGYEFPFGLGFSARYMLGFPNIFKGGYTYPDTNSPYPRTITQGPYGNNGVLQVSLSYMFGMNK